MSQREVLLDAAERLFADRGIEATSLRAIMAEAGTNVAAVSYHFGSKDELLASLIRHRSAAIGDAREPHLCALESATSPSAHDLAATIVEPVAALALRGEDAWIRVVATIGATHREPGWTMLNETFAPQARRLGAVLRRIDPSLRRSTVRFRMAEATSMCFRVLGDLDFVRTNTGSRSHPTPAADVVDDLRDAVAAILSGPCVHGAPPVD